MTPGEIPPVPSRRSCPSCGPAKTEHPRSADEIVGSLRREGWQHCAGTVFRSRDGKFAKVVWFDGSSAQGPIIP